MYSYHFSQSNEEQKDIQTKLIKTKCRLYDCVIAMRCYGMPSLAPSLQVCNQGCEGYLHLMLKCLYICSLLSVVMQHFNSVPKDFIF